MASSRRSAKSAEAPLPAAEVVLAAIDAALVAAGLVAAPDRPLLLVAFSGGLDSSMLLHALTTRRDRVRLHAVHVHHGLQALADDWSAHCEAIAAALDEAEASLARGEGRPITAESMAALAEEVKRRGRRRLDAEAAASR